MLRACVQFGSRETNVVLLVFQTQDRSAHKKNLLQYSYEYVCANLKKKTCLRN